MVSARSCGIGWWLARLRTWLAAALLSGSLASCISVSPSPPSSPQATSSPTASPVAATFPILGPTTASSIVVPYTAWRAIAIPEPTPIVYGGSSVEAALAFGSGYLAVGQVNGGCCDASFSTDTHGVVWRSTDGLRWTMEARAKSFDLAHLTGIATDGRTVIIAGSLMLDSTYYPGQIDPKGAVWTSEDGQTWTRTTGMPTFSNVVHAAGAYLGVTQEPIPDPVWRSVDGRTWTPAAGPKELGPGTISDLIATPLGLIAVGSTETPAQATAVSWRSLDGRSWTRSSVQASLVGASMSRVAASGSMIVATGRGPDLARVWWSTDGLNWTADRDDVFGAPASSIDGLVSGSSGFVVSGTIDQDSPPFGVWASSDGRGWGIVESTLKDGGPSELCAIDRGSELTLFGVAFDAARGRAVPAAWAVR
jgi:hypothetical protein